MNMEILNNIPNKIKLLIIGVLYLAVLFLLNIESINPNFPIIYDLKRAQEKVYLSLKSSPEQKADYYNFLLTRRLNELEDVAKNKEYGYVLTSSQRYATTLGELTEIIKNNQLNDQIEPLKTKLNYHKQVLTNLINEYPKAEDTEWKYIQDDYNYIDIYLSQLN